MNTQLAGPKHARADVGRAHRGRSLLAAAAASLVALTGLSGVALADESQSGAQSGVDNSAVGVDATSNQPAEGEGSGSEGPDAKTQSTLRGSEQGSLVTDSTAKETAEQSVSAQSAQSSIFTCQAGYIYSMQSNGNVLQVDPSGATSDVVVASGNTTGSSMNGLGIGSEGETAFWYERSGTNSSQVSYLVKFANGSSSRVSNSGSTGFGTESLVAGAVDPTTGNLLLGKIKNQRVYLWAWTGSAYSALGYASDSKLPNDGLNGDMAFDAAGNLYVVSSSDPNWRGKVTVNITLVKAADIAAAIAVNNPNRNISGANVSTKTISAASGFNGIAFDSNGYVYVGNGTTLMKYDPTSWELLSTVTGNLGKSTDLSSCSTPPTLEVLKDLPAGRARSGDQFTLGISDSAGTSLTTVTTTGSESGVQADSAGPAPVVAGHSYQVSETAGNQATSMGDYVSSLVCVDEANSNTPVTVTNGRLTIPTGKSNSARVVCTFTNTPAKGSAEWSKVDDATPGNLLAGSEWTLKGPSYPTGVTVVDNGDLDVDKANGRFRVDNLQYGSYTLTESKAPTGFVSDTQVHTFTVSGADNGIVQVGAITNVPVKGSVKWTKVGDSGPDDLLAGTTWTLTPTDPAGQPITVVDNQGRDADPAAGKFLVNDLPYGKYTISEASAPEGFELNTGSFPFTISENGATVTVNDGVPIVNKRTLGSVTWKKSDEGGNALSGSEWELTGPDGTSATVVDNQTPDGDPADGAFRVEGLTWGNYTLVETKAPAGYQRLDTEFSFTIDGAHLQAVINEGHAIVNKQQVPPSLPLTGGLGTDSFLLAGGGLLALAGIGGWIHRRRSQRLRMA